MGAPMTVSDTRNRVLLALRKERLKQLMAGHEWDVADVMEVLDSEIDWKKQND